MAEVVHEHVGSSESSSGIGFMLGMLLVVVLVALLFFFGLPRLTEQGSGQTITPGGNIPSANININPQK